MAKADSTRKRPGARARINSSEPKPKVVGSSHDDRHDFGEILGRFSDALALVETSLVALETAQEDESPISPAVLTLQRGVHELQDVYTEFDRAIAWLERNAP